MERRWYLPDTAISRTKGFIEHYLCRRCIRFQIQISSISSHRSTLRDLPAPNVTAKGAAENQSDGKRALCVPKGTERRGRYKTATQGRSWFCTGRLFLGQAAFRRVSNTD